MTTKNLLTGAALATVLAMAGSASAATYVTNLEHKDNNLSVDGFFGTVTITEEDDFNILVTVALEAPLTMFVDGGKHTAFSFNLEDVDDIEYEIVTPVGGGSFVPLDSPTYSNPPFGNNAWQNGFQCCGNGSSNGQLAPFVFRITSSSAITFAGVDAEFDPDTGRLVTPGTGPRFASTGAGWWFAADVSDGTNTGAIAARDAFLQQTAVPEPATWAFMIMGFGGAGAMIRRRRALAA